VPPAYTYIAHYKRQEYNTSFVSTLPSTYIVNYKREKFTSFVQKLRACVVPPTLTYIGSYNIRSQTHHLYSLWHRPCLYYMCEHILQIHSVLSATPGEQTHGRKYFTFPFATFTTNEIRACVYPPSSPLLTALHIHATTYNIHYVRPRWGVSCTQFSTPTAILNHPWRHYSPAHPQNTSN
jgi:hypothetical protein